MASTSVDNEEYETGNYLRVHACGVGVVRESVTACCIVLSLVGGVCRLCTGSLSYSVPLSSIERTAVLSAAVRPCDNFMHPL
jgi:hypothetical protein